MRLPQSTTWASLALIGFADLYARHLRDENDLVYPAALAALAPDALQTLREAMSEGVGVVRDAAGLASTLAASAGLEAEAPGALPLVAARLIAERGGTLVHAFGDPWVIEGQGSAAIEIAAQLGRAPSRIIACCGGGGLAAGLALGAPDSAIHPVEPVGWDDVARSLATGEIQRVGPNPPRTICDSIQTPSTAPINFRVLRDRASAGVTVSDAEVRAAQRFAFAKLQVVVEPGGAAALAAALAGKVPLDEWTVVTITGGNTDADAFARSLLTDE